MRTGPSRRLSRLQTYSTFCRRSSSSTAAARRSADAAGRQVALLDQQGVVRRLVPDRGQEVRLHAQPGGPLGRFDGGDHLVLGELFAGQARVMRALVQELDQRRLAVVADAADQVARCCSGRGRRRSSAR